MGPTDPMWRRRAAWSIALVAFAAAWSGVGSEAGGRASPSIGPQGRSVWKATFDASYAATDLDVAPGGERVYVTGLGGIDQDYVALAYAAGTGSDVWRGIYRGVGGLDYAQALAAGPLGQRVYVTGDSQGQGSTKDIATVAFDSGSGALLWAARYEGPDGLDDLGRDVAVSSDEAKVFTTGVSVKVGATDAVTARTALMNSVMKLPTTRPPAMSCGRCGTALLARP